VWFFQHLAKAHSQEWLCYAAFSAAAEACSTEAEILVVLEMDHFAAREMAKRKVALLKPRLSLILCANYAITNQVCSRGMGKIMLPAWRAQHGFC
jgi:hypothetical protein